MGNRVSRGLIGSTRWSNWAWDKPVKAFIWRSSRICRPIGGLPPWFFEESLPHFLLRNNSIVQQSNVFLMPLSYKNTPHECKGLHGCFGRGFFEGSRKDINGLNRSDYERLTTVTLD